MFSKKRLFGNTGEDVACKFLVKRGFKIIERNYLRKAGEIDIIAKKGLVLHFVEVKTISWDGLGVTQETNTFRPEDNLHQWKLKRISRAIQIYLFDKNISDEIEWIFDIIIVLLDRENNLAKVNIMENIILNS